MEKLIGKFKSFDSMLSEQDIHRKFECYANLPCVVSEKIHGCNFSFYYLPCRGEGQNASIVYASRNQILDAKQNFMQHRAYFTEQLEQSLLERFSQLPKAQDPRLVYIRIIGELFPTQKKVKYGDEKRFAVFHIEYRLQEDNDNGAKEDPRANRTHCTWDEVMAICLLLRLETVPIIEEVRGQTFGEIWKNYDICFDSKLSAQTNNVCEGICFRIEPNDVICEIVADDGETSEAREKMYESTTKELIMAKKHAVPIFVKKRNHAFLERKQGKNAPGPNLNVLQKIKSLCTRQRVLNMDSKFDFNRFQKQQFAQAVIEDVKIDYNREFQDDPDYEDLSDEDFLRYKKTINKCIEPFIRDVLKSKAIVEGEKTNDECVL